MRTHARKGGTELLHNGEQMDPRTDRWMHSLPDRACHTTSLKSLKLSIPDHHHTSVQNAQWQQFLP